MIWPGSAGRAGQSRIGWDEAFLHPLFLLHAAILEPDFHLCLVELKGAGDFDSPGASQVLVKVELLLQLGQLLGREVGPARVVDAAPGARLTSVAVTFGLRNCNVDEEQNF